jgi:hypothetical protein
MDKILEKMKTLKPDETITGVVCESDLNFLIITMNRYYNNYALLVEYNRPDFITHLFQNKITITNKG